MSLDVRVGDLWKDVRGALWKIVTVSDHWVYGQILQLSNGRKIHSAHGAAYRAWSRESGKAHVVRPMHETPSNRDSNWWFGLEVASSDESERRLSRCVSSAPGPRTPIDEYERPAVFGTWS